MEQTIDIKQIKPIIEAVLLAAGEPLSIERLKAIFAEEEQQPDAAAIKTCIEALEQDYQDRSFNIKRLASGYCLQVKADYAPWVGRIWEEKPPRYSLAFLETLAIIAYRQPVTRAEIEDVRGVAVSSYIMKTMLEREWIKLLGHRDVPGRPGIYGTTKQFLDYFNLASLEQLPTLAELQDVDSFAKQLELQIQEEVGDMQAMAD